MAADRSGGKTFDGLNGLVGITPSVAGSIASLAQVDRPVGFVVDVAVSSLTGDDEVDFRSDLPR